MSKADKDLHARALKRFAEARDLWSAQHKQMREDLAFSNPSKAEQWDEEAKRLRKGRVMLTLDRTNQYIVQIVNDARKNKPGINTVPVDSRADVDVAKQIDGIIRHIEYRSRAPIAYDTAIDHAARCGVGWLRIVPEVIRSDTNEQEICIKRVHDPLSVTLLGGTEPDGSDATDAFVTTRLTADEFKRKYPKAGTQSWESDGQWFDDDDGVTVCEWRYVEETERNQIRIANDEGEEFTLGEDDYWDLAKKLGYQPQRVGEPFMATDRVVHWCMFNGAEVLERTTFPSRWLGIVPVLGFELWVDGKRQVCGATRRLMESQRAYNYERSALVEAIALQPKAPIMVPVASVAGHDDAWATLNKGQPAYLPYNHVDGDGNPVPAPSRLAPPAFPAAFAQAGQQALSDMEAAIGITRSGLGQPSSATSGLQERERKEESDTATFHFPDNLSRAIEFVGRVVVDMIPRIWDTKRQARLLGHDGQHSAVEIDPEGPAIQRRGKKIVSINPGVGTYDVRVVAGANYTTQRQEAAEGIAEILQAAPQMIPVLGPALIKLRDWPDAEKHARMMVAMAPPEVQAIVNEGEEEGPPEIPPQVRAQMQQMQEQMQQMSAMLDKAEEMAGELQALKADKSLEARKLEIDAEMKARELDIDAARAETERMSAEVAALRPVPAEVDDAVDLTQ